MMDGLEVSIAAYLDDLVIYSDSCDEHVQHIRTVSTDFETQDSQQNLRGASLE